MSDGREEREEMEKRLEQEALEGGEGSGRKDWSGRERVDEREQEREES